MRRTSTSAAWAAVAAIGCGAVLSAPAVADESAAEAVAAVAGAVNDPNCIAGAVANQAVAEGLKRGRKLLGQLGINAPRGAPAGAPCGGATAEAAAPAPAATTAATPAAAPAPAERAQRRGGFLSGMRGGQQGQTRQRNCGALGAGCMDGMKPLVACMDEVSFWGEMADAVEQKRNSAQGLSAEQLADMDADIAAMRAAHAKSAPRVDPVDPSKPSRHTDWLTPEEYSVAATAASQKLNAHREDCNRRYSGF